MPKPASPYDVLARLNKPKPSKFGNVRVGRYASKFEASYAGQLELRCMATNGDVLYWLEQVRVPLSAGTYVCDFLVFKRDGSHEYVEVKGFETAIWKRTYAQLRNEHPEIFSRLTVVKKSR